MIARLHGILLVKTPPMVLLDVHGVGYEVQVSMQTFYALPPLNENLTLHIHMAVRDDAHLLFGFIDEAEKSAFRYLLKVNGIGAKTALAILSVMDAPSLAIAINQEDDKKLSSVPGIGKKTAERMILELRDKMPLVQNATTHNTNTPDHTDDIINTLTALGYSEREAKSVTKGLPENLDVVEGVRLALKNLSRQ